MQEIPILVERMVWLLLSMYMMIYAVKELEKSRRLACLFRLAFAIVDVYFFLTIQ